MPHHRIAEVARVLGVSDDTVRRWVDAGRLSVTQDDAGRALVDGADLARIAQELAPAEPALTAPVQSARNHFPGVVTEVRADGVMAQVEIQSGPHRVVSLMSREAAEDLSLERGALAVASVKATVVVVDLPAATR